MRITENNVYGDSKRVHGTQEMINTSILVVVTALPTRGFYTLMSTNTGYTKCIFPAHLTPNASGLSLPP